MAKTFRGQKMSWPRHLLAHLFRGGTSQGGRIRKLNPYLTRACPRACPSRTKATCPWSFPTTKTICPWPSDAGTLEWRRLSGANKFRGRDIYWPASFVWSCQGCGIRKRSHIWPEPVLEPVPNAQKQPVCGLSRPDISDHKNNLSLAFRRGNCGVAKTFRGQ